MSNTEKTIYETVMALEEGEADEATASCDLQRLINSGTWSLQGSFGRAMMRAIEDGDCCLGKVAARDAYGNRIPSRDEVQDGTKGSIGFVKAKRGAEWAEMIAAVE